MAQNRTYYQILGVTAEASDQEIKRAYHRLARQFHPDKAPSPEEAGRMETEFAAISTAYNALKNKQKRREYDEQLSKGQAVEPSASFSQAAADAAAAEPAAPSGSGGPRRPTRMETFEARQSIAKKAFSRGMQFYNQ
ncbi:MAG: DnaJ domain-containing protein, partial [Candidatus Sumerlaeota bacterium]|nr:DnaJ domain-containing protein [Candidatus Sumerlaeota bacterium]